MPFSYHCSFTITIPWLVTCWLVASICNSALVKKKRKDGTQMTRTGERGCSKNAQDSASKDAPASLARTGHANVTQPVPLSPSLHVAESIGLHAESIALHRRYVAMPWKLYATAAVQTPSPLTNTEPKTSLLFFARTGTRKTKTKLIHLISATIMYVFHRVSSNKNVVLLVTYYLHRILSAVVNFRIQHLTVRIILKIYEKK